MRVALLDGNGKPCRNIYLFAAHLSRETARRRVLALAELVLSRTLLLSVIFGIAACVGPEGFSTGAAMTMLDVLGAIYLVSRRIYLPVPHVEFFRLIPGHGRVPHGIRLGLTLSACTLPLVVVVGVIAALARQPEPLYHHPVVMGRCFFDLENRSLIWF